MPGTAHADPSPIRQLAGDIGLAVRIAAAWLTSMVLPERFWRSLTRAIGHAVVSVRPKWRRAQLAELKRRLGEGDREARLEILIDRVAFGHESRLYGLREYRPGGQEHAVRLVGSEFVRAGLAAENGVILWVAPFVFATLTTKIALHEAGFAVSHLSRTAHGFSDSRIAVRWLNPLWTRIEERYLHERIVMSPTNQLTALRSLRARLGANQVISIAVGDEGVKTVTVPLLEAELCLATGPMTLAAATGAPLVPVFTVRDSTGRLRVDIQRPLEVGNERDRQQMFTNVGRQYAERLAPFAKDYAGQWLS